MNTEAMKLALEALKHIHPSPLTSFYTIGDRDKAIKALEEALANHIPNDTKMVSGVKNSLTTQQEKGEPVAWRTFNGEGGYDYRSFEDNENYKEDYIKRNGDKYKDWVEPLYTTPQQCKPLTDEQIVAGLEAAGVEFHRFMGGIGGSKDIWATSGSQPVQKIAAGVRAMLAAHGIKE